MQQTERALIILLASIVGPGKEVPSKAEAFGKTRQNLHTQLPRAVLEIQHDPVELRDHCLVRPEIIHMWKGYLIRLFFIRRAGGWPYL